MKNWQHRIVCLSVSTVLYRNLCLVVRCSGPVGQPDLPHSFVAIQQMTMVAYFTSRIGIKSSIPCFKLSLLVVVGAIIDVIIGYGGDSSVGVIIVCRQRGRLINDWHCLSREGVPTCAYSAEVNALLAKQPLDPPANCQIVRRSYFRFIPFRLLC